MSHSSTAREINDESLRGRDETPAINDFGLVDVLAGPRSGPLSSLPIYGLACGRGICGVRVAWFSYKSLSVGHMCERCNTARGRPRAVAL